MKTKKYCPRCEKELHIKLFYKDAGRHDGVQPYCIVCKQAESSRIYRENPFRYHYGRHRAVLKKILRKLGNCVQRGVPLEKLYTLTVKTILKNKKKAALIFPNGKPDAVLRKVEFKTSLDNLRDNQIVWDILNKRKCKVRWFPTYDELDKTLAFPNRDFGGKEFRSYKEFILWKYGQ